MLWISFSNYFSGTVPNDTAARYMIQVPSRDQYEAIPHLVPYGSFVTPHNSGIKSLLDVQNCTYTSERCEINKREVIDHWSEDIHRWRGRCSSLDGVVTGPLTDWTSSDQHEAGSLGWQYEEGSLHLRTGWRSPERWVHSTCAHCSLTRVLFYCVHVCSTSLLLPYPGAMLRVVKQELAAQSVTMFTHKKNVS